MGFVVIGEGITEGLFEALEIIHLEFFLGIKEGIPSPVQEAEVPEDQFRVLVGIILITVLNFDEHWAHHSFIISNFPVTPDPIRQLNKPGLHILVLLGPESDHGVQISEILFFENGLITTTIRFWLLLFKVLYIGFKLFGLFVPKTDDLFIEQSLHTGDTPYIEGLLKPRIDEIHDGIGDLVMQFCQLSCVLRGKVDLYLVVKGLSRLIL